MPTTPICVGGRRLLHRRQHGGIRAVLRSAGPPCFARRRKTPRPRRWAGLFIFVGIWSLPYIWRKRRGDGNGHYAGSGVVRLKRGTHADAGIAQDTNESTVLADWSLMQGAWPIRATALFAPTPRRGTGCGVSASIACAGNQ